MENIDENGDSATETAVDNESVVEDTTRNIKDAAGLAKLFDGTPLEEVSQDADDKVAEIPEETEENQESEVKATEEESQDDESDETKPEEEEDQQEESTNVLSKHEKTIRKLKKRVDKTTKNWKTAEEELEAKNSYIEKLERQAKDGTFAQEQANNKTFADYALESDSQEELGELYEKAEKAEAWAEDRLDELRESGEDSIEHNGIEFPMSQIKDLKRDARAAMKKAIPAKQEFFKQRQAYDEQAVNTFEFLKDPESDTFKATEKLMADEAFNGFINHFPEGTYILGLIGEGITSIDSKMKATATATEKKEITVKKEKRKEKIAPAVPGLDSKITPRNVSSDEKKVKTIQSIRSKSKLDVNDLQAVFMTT